MKFFFVTLFCVFISVTYSQQISGSSEFKSIEFNSSIQIIEKTLPPLLEVSDIKFSDANQNNRLDANETCDVSFKINNVGKGMAKNIKITVSNITSEISGFTWDKSRQIALIPSGSSENVTISFKGNIDLLSGKLKMGFSFSETSGFAPDAFDLDIETKEFAKPEIRVVDERVVSESGAVQRKKKVTLTTLIQNVGQGEAQSVNVSFVLPDNVFPSSELSFAFPNMKPNEQKQINFEFLINDRYVSNTVPIKINLGEKYGKFAQSKTVNVTIDSKTDKQIISIASNAKDQTTEITQGSLTSDVDKDIPVNSFKNSNRYALVIGNEDYSSRNSGLNSESNVAFAVVDAQIFSEYAVNTLGVPRENLQLLINATGGEMNSQIEKFTKLLNLSNGKGELIFYYAGHGLPDEATNIPYIVPVDGNYGNLTKSGVNLYDMYNSFGSTNASQVLVFMDACFSGGARDAGLVAARALKIKPKKGELIGNIVVFAATSAEQAAMPYNDKRHGLFTYFLLKKIKESKGQTPLGELGDFVTNSVAKQSLLVNQKEQSPEVLISEKLLGTWKSTKLINY